MNKKILQILVFSFMAQRVFAVDLQQIKCELNKSAGYVYLTGQLGVQKMMAYVGTESFDDPYKIRIICNSLIAEIGSVVAEQWEDFGCDQTDAVEIKQLGFQLTQQGANILNRESQTIWFRPDAPLSKEFIRSKYSPSCDPL